ncbi:MAG: ligase-associated DNA damage response DEXH box helicase [Phycisphaerales bacterium]
MNERAQAWFDSRGWKPFPFQLDAWRAYAQGRSALIHAPTGTGKTLAAWLGPVMEALDHPDRSRQLRVLWLTPLRALANDTAESLQAALEGVGLKWTVELRTGDTSQAKKKRQRETMPHCLITTPESLSVMLSYADLSAPGGPLSGIRCVVVDEWHELLGSKRGVQTELGLARLRTLSPGLRTWGLSATLDNLDEALRVLTGVRPAGPAPRLIAGIDEKIYSVQTVIPPDIERFPWAGHIGLRLLPQVIELIERARSTLLFTNVRSQAEIWFQALTLAREDWLGQIAIHHGSLDRDLRRRVEDHLRRGDLRCVVCTSSLDLGVDFQPVDQVIQIGSPKGVARLLQRAGRSGHQPGRTSRVVCIPTHALELVEFAAARDAIEGRDASPGRRRSVEPRPPLRLAMDVLAQHVLTRAVGGGFDEDQLKNEVRATHAFEHLTDEQWSWVMDFAIRGGPALKSYEQYARVTKSPDDGLYHVSASRISRLHRLGIGTITSDASILVKFVAGRTLGSVEEGFISRMRIGDTFAFAGRLLKLVRVRDMTAYVKAVRARKGVIPRWDGARMALSTHLARAVRVRLDEAHRGIFDGPELHAARPILELQDRWSSLPRPGSLLVEHWRARDGDHLFFYPLEGRLVHEGLAALTSYRLSRIEPRTFTLAASDYGFHLHSPTPIAPTEPLLRAALASRDLAEDLLECMNAAQLAKRRFREVARVAGLIVPGFPGAPRSTRQLQASSELFYDVLSQFDPGNLLLDQARREVLEKQLEVARLQATLETIAAAPIRLVSTKHLTPFGFPLWVDSLREQLSSEKWEDRVRRMLAQLEAEAGPSYTPPAIVTSTVTEDADAPLPPPAHTRR